MAKLYVVPASHPSAAAMAALELKGIAYERVDLVPVLHRMVLKARFGGAGTVPALLLDDGRKVVGSRAIVGELERLRRDPPLFPPAGTHRRQLVEEAEEWGDQTLQPLVRRVLWKALSNDAAAQLSYLDGARLVPPAPRPFARLAGGAVAATERRLHGVDDGAVRADLAHLGTHLDRIDRWIEHGVLTLDGAPNAADLQIGASVRLLLTIEDVAPRVEARPAGRHARRWFARYPGRTPPGALPSGWLG
jgi:glutathione S-transferase